MLDTAVQWVELGNEQIHGQSCDSYEGTRLDESGKLEKVVLWIAANGHIPVEMLALTTQDSTSHGAPGAGGMPAAPRTPITQVVTWSDWDNPVLVIPAH